MTMSTGSDQFTGKPLTSYNDQKMTKEKRSFNLRVTGMRTVTYLKIYTKENRSTGKEIVHQFP